MVGRIDFGNITAGPSSVLNGRIAMDRGSNMMFYTNGTTEQMKITSIGRVGIGSTTPSLLLHLNSTAAAEPANSGTAATGTSRISVGDSPVVLDIGIADDAYYGAWLQTHFSNNLATNAPLLLNPNGGTVGIGTTSPDAASQLTVNGSTRIQGTNGAILMQDQGSTATYRMEVSGLNWKLFYGANANPTMYVSGWNTFLGANSGFGGDRLTVGSSGDGSRAVANTWAVFSDIRYKENIHPLENSLEKILRIRGVSYDWKKSGIGTIGFVAQELEEIIPEMVYTNDEGYKSVDYSRITPLLVESIKEQQATINSLLQQLQELQNEVEELKKK